MNKLKKPEQIIKEAREAKGLTQTEMGERLGLGLEHLNELWKVLAA